MRYGVDEENSDGVETNESMTIEEGHWFWECTYRKNQVLISK